MVGEDVTVTLLGVKGNHVRLGFTAPAKIAVHREEVYERMQAERVDGTLESRATLIRRSAART
jgi:carbon storage regulator